jgi:hypothetical protein
MCAVIHPRARLSSLTTLRRVEVPGNARGFFQIRSPGDQGARSCQERTRVAPGDGSEAEWCGPGPACSERGLGALTIAPDALSPAKGTSGPYRAPNALLSDAPTLYEAATLDEIKREQAAVPGEYDEAHFVVTRWRSGELPEIPDFRRRMLDRVVEQGKPRCI